MARFARALASQPGTLGLPARLCESSRATLDADGASILVSSSGGSQLVVCSTDEQSTRMQDAEEVAGEGPSRDAQVRDETVVVSFDHVPDRWPLLREQEAYRHFSGTVVAVPLRSESVTVGVLMAHRSGEPRDDDVRSCAFLSVAVGSALVQDPQLERPDLAYADTWPSRAKIHQATGMIVAQLGVHPHDAVALLRGQAFTQGRTMSEVADQVIDRRINFRDFTIEGD